MSEKVKGIFALVALSLVFGTIGIFVRYFDPDFTILQQGYVRIAIAALLGLIIFFPSLEFRKLLNLPTQDLWVSLLRAAFFYAGVFLFSVAVTSTNFGNVSLIAVVPLLPVLGYVLLGQKVTLKQVLFVLVGFVGVVLIAVPDFSNILHWGRGELFALASSILFDISYLASNWQTKYLSNKESSVLILAMGAGLLFFASLLIGESLPSFSAFGAVTIGAFVLSALLNIAIIFLISYGFPRVSAAVAGNILTLESVFAVLVGVLLYAEIPTLQILLGGVVVIFSVYKMNQIS